MVKESPSAVETVAALFDAIARFDTATVAGILHNDLRHELPFEPGMPTLDKPGLLETVAGLATMFQRFELNIVETIETADPQRAVVRYDGDCLSNDGSVSYCNNYIGLFTVTDGQISEIREYANPLISRRMFEQLSAMQSG